MQDSIYCYSNSDVLKNKLNIQNSKDLFYAEIKLTMYRLEELIHNPIEGNFDFLHLKEIHKYIFQDLYDWAGKVRTVEIGKGNMFCPTKHIDEYAKTVFYNYYKECFKNKDDFEKFVASFANNYGDLNALHPFREGNGRTQREFARLVCLKCGYDFDLSNTTHKQMLEASILSFNKGDNSLFIDIFKNSIKRLGEEEKSKDKVQILSLDDLIYDIEDTNCYDYYDKEELIDSYNEIYQEKINKMKDRN